MAVVRFEESVESGQALKGVLKKITMEDRSEVAVVAEGDRVKLTVHCPWTHKLAGIELTREHAPELKELLAEALEAVEGES